MKTFFLAAILVLAVSTAAVGADAPFKGRLGVEASGDAFVDLVKQSYRWEKADGPSGWTKLTSADVDAHGWPKTDCQWVLDSRPCAEWTGQIDDPEAHRPDLSGVYQGSFLGKAKLAVSGGSCTLADQAYDALSNRTTFNLVASTPGPNHYLIVLEFRDTQRAANSAAHTGISDFKLLRPGYPASTAQVFTNEYLACLQSAAFSTIRFMGVTNTNGNVEWGRDHTRLQSWNNRKVPEDAAVETIEPLNKKDGWPWEYVISLCNQANMDAWINIPMSADEDYVHQLALLLKARLKPTLNIYLEHSNEVWNFGFIQYAWNKAKAKEEIHENQAHYNFDGVENEEVWAQRRHAQQVKSIVRVFADVFGREQINQRVRGVLAGVTGDPNGFFVAGRLAGMLDYLKATGGDPQTYIYAISIPAYYGGKAASGDAGTEHATVAEILADMQADVAQSKGERLAVVWLATRFALPGGFCAYESGPDVGGGRATNIGNRIRAIRDPAQGTIYKANLTDGFWNIGANLAMQFTLASPYSRYGAWGLTDDVSKPDRNSLFPTVRELVGGAR